tara:strand:+ start:7977 stop:8198 length:222 start_codon:yes stop_codon:yes gene_type:complete
MPDITLSDDTFKKIETSVTLGVKRALFDYQNYSIEKLPENLEKVLTGTIKSFEKSLPSMIKSFKNIEEIISKS